jgi:hypothetical protein
MARQQGTRVRIFLFLAQLFGWVAAGALIMTGIFSEGGHASHSLWSNVLYISFGTAVFLSGWAFLYYPGFSRRLSYFAFIVILIDWIMSAFNRTHFLEWIMVALLLLYVGVVSRRMILVGRARWKNAVSNTAIARSSGPQARKPTAVSGLSAANPSTLVSEVGGDEGEICHAKNGREGG